MFDTLDDIVQKQQRYDATSKRRDEKIGHDRATMTDPAMARVTLDLLVHEAISEAAVDAASYNREAADIRGRINREIEHHENRLTQELHVERDNADNARRAEVANLDADMGESSDARAALVKKERTASEELSAVRARVVPARRPLRTHWVGVYIPLMVLIALLEMPLNQLSFELLLRGAPIFSWLLALACGAALVVFAHLAGVWLRQLNPEQRTPVALVAGIIRLIFVIGIAGLAIYIIAALRQRYVDFRSTPQGSLSQDVLAEPNSLEQVASTLAAAATDTTLSAVGWLILGLNVIFFAAGMLLAFRRHDPDPDYERATKNNEAATRAVRDHQEKYRTRRKRLDEKFAEHLKYLNEEIADAGARLEATKANLDILSDRRDPDLAVIARCAISRAEHRVGGFYARIASRGITLPKYDLPTIGEVLAEFETQHPQATSRTANGHDTFDSQPFATRSGRPRRPTGPSSERPAGDQERPFQ